MVDDSVFMIGWEYPPHNSGGLGVACQGLTQALAAQGQQIYFTLPYHLMSGTQAHMQILECYDQQWFDGDNSVPPFQAYSPLPFKVKDLTVDDLHTLPQSELELRVNQYADYVTEAAERVEQHIQGIHAHDWMSFPAAAQIKRELGRPMVAHVHSTEFDRIPSGYGSQYIHQTEYLGLQAADKIIAVSNYTKRLIVNKYGVDPNKIVVVYNGVDPLPKSSLTLKKNFASDRPVIVFMGRLTMQKGVEYFLELAKKTLQKLPTALFIVAGHGDQYSSLLLKNADMNLSAHVLFTGFVRGKQRDDLLNRADVFVMPSISEPFGLVALEAAQRNTPVLISKNSGVAEVMPGAKIVDFWDVDKMAAEISLLVQDKSQHNQVVANQLKNLEKVTWNQAAGRIKRLYRQVFTGNL